MKIMEVRFEHVRDCPQWAEGKCLHPDGTGECFNWALSFQPKHCPAADEQDSNAVKKVDVSLPQCSCRGCMNPKIVGICDCCGGVVTKHPKIKEEKCLCDTCGVVLCAGRGVKQFASMKQGGVETMGKKLDFQRGDEKKKDHGKPMWDLLPLQQVGHIVDVLTFGAKKYGPNTWQTVDNATERYFAALMRHLVAWRSGQIFDDESKLRHLAHALCCLIFLSWMEDRRLKKRRKIKCIDVKLLED